MTGRCRRILLLCDCDGTLVPIFPRPQDTIIPPAVLALLADLIACPGLRVGIISGRPADDLRRFFPLPGLYLAALHGALLTWPEGREEWLVQRPAPEILRPLLAAAREVAAANPGVVLEEKETGLAFHYRLARAGERAALAFAEGVRPLLEQAGLEILRGNQVLEIRPRGVHKGLAVRHLAQAWPGALPVYLGDDVTDEDAFRETNLLGGVSILVGLARSSAATARLPGVDAVWRFLRDLSRGLSRPGGISLDPPLPPVR